jgi:hypothetical protein
MMPTTRASRYTMLYGAMSLCGTQFRLRQVLRDEPVGTRAFGSKVSNRLVVDAQDVADLSTGSTRLLTKPGRHDPRSRLPHSG